MLLNVVLLILGIAFLAYGIKHRLKFWAAAGVLLLCLGGISAYIDVTAAGMDGIANSRIPVVIDRFVR